MSGFNKIIELKRNIQQVRQENNYQKGDALKKQDYITSLKKTFKNLEFKDSDIDWFK